MLVLLRTGLGVCGNLGVKRLCGLQAALVAYTFITLQVVTTFVEVSRKAVGLQKFSAQV